MRNLLNMRACGRGSAGRCRWCLRGFVEEQLLLAITKVLETIKTAGASKDRQQAATDIAKATGIWHIKQWELGRKNATSGYFSGSFY